MVTLEDDGTLDTVLRCSKCGVEERFNFQELGHEADYNLTYDEFVESNMAHMEEEHECEQETI